MSDDEEGGNTYQVIFDDEPDKIYPYLPAKDGKASASFPNGDSYVGDYKGGKKHGKGVYKFVAGAKYDGEYEENLKSGFGIFYAPDKGKYTGNWSKDKRSGKGTYVYPNGDSFTGNWRNGAKHGPGCYTFNGIASAMKGTWSNGQCVDGTWNIHDSSSYTGAFLSNQPSGDGLYKFSNGNSASGSYQEQQFVRETFSRPHPDTDMPEAKPAENFRKACRAVDKAVSKADHYNEMHQLKAQFQGAPNLRRTKGTSVVACGQPTLAAFRSLQENLTEGGMDKITWVNVRDDAVLYVGGLPFSPVDARDLEEPLHLGLDAAQLGELEKRLMENAKFEVKKQGNLHEYFEHKVNPETLEKTVEQKTIQVKVNPETGVLDVKSAAAMHEFLVEDEHAVEYKRVPLPVDKAPSTESFDSLAKVIREMEGGGIVLQDALGGTKASTATAIALLMLGTGGGGEEEEEAGDGGEGDEGDAPKKKEKEEETYDELAPDLTKSQYDMVMKLVTTLNGEDPEIARQKKLEEDAKAKAEEEAKKAAEEEAKKAAEAEAAEGEAPAEGEEEKKEGEEAAEEAAEGGEGEGAEEKVEGEEAAEGGEAEEKSEPLVWIKNGTIVKAQVDDVLDKCSEMGHLRTCINDVKAKFDVASEDEQAAIKRQAASFLERYCYLLLFAAYLKDLKDGKLAPEPAAGAGGEGDEEEEGGSTVQSFTKWCADRAELLESIGTRTKGPLAEFNWS